MTCLELTPDLRRAATRCVWFKSPDEAVENPAEFTAYVLTYGLRDDWRALRDQVTDEQLRAWLETAPPGVFDARSWAYWHHVLGKLPVPPRPVRTFPTSTS